MGHTRVVPPEICNSIKFMRKIMTTWSFAGRRAQATFVEPPRYRPGRHGTLLRHNSAVPRPI